MFSTDKNKPSENKLIKTILTTSKVNTLGLSILSGALVYGICIIIFKVDEVNLIINTVKKKLKKI